MLPLHATIEAHGLKPLGWIRCGAVLPTSDGDEANAAKRAGEPNTIDLVTLGKFVQSNEAMVATGAPLTTVIVCLDQSGASVRADTVTDAGIVWATAAQRKAEVHAAPGPLPTGLAQSCAVRVSDRIDGCFFVPVHTSWNYSWRGKGTWAAEYAVACDVPKEFYHPTHRSTHFRSFARLGESSAGDAVGASGNSGFIDTADQEGDFGRFS
jgi:hypothetical protein